MGPIWEFSDKIDVPLHIGYFRVGLCIKILVLKKKITLLVYGAIHLPWGGLLPPKRSFAVLWPPINCLCLREKGTKFGLNYPTVRLSVADYLCPYHSVILHIIQWKKIYVYPLYEYLWSCTLFNEKNNMFTHFMTLK